MARLAIIIPCWQPDELLENTLVSVLQNRPSQCDIFVVHFGSYDDPYDLSGEVCFVEVSNGDLVTAINRAIDQADCHIVHLLQCGAEVEDGWTDSAVEHFDHQACGCVIPIVVDGERPECVVAAGAKPGWNGFPRVCGRGQNTDSRRLKRLRPRAATAIAAFYRKSALEAVGMFEPKVGNALAALDMGLSLRHAGYRTEFEPASKIYFHPNDAATLPNPFVQGLHAERVVWRNAVNRSWLRIWAGRLPILVWETLGGLFRPKQLAKPMGRVFAWSEWRRFRKHHRRLPAAAQSENQTEPQETETHRRIDGPHDCIRQAETASADSVKAT